ncbi:phosphoadenosine phosphosulfate reductase [Thozetella sp. PMI_491]|nr:phosphoadenosine phosphosulfate reductase [Thozetella sp. PMI_491]
MISSCEMVQDREPGQNDEAQLPAPKTNGLVKSIAPQSHSPRSLEDVARDLDARVTAFLAEEAPNDVLKATQEQVRTALETIGTALRQYEHSELSVAYNGGKDCLVLLVLIIAALARRYPRDGVPSDPSAPAAPPTPFPTTLQAVYVVSQHPFAEVDTFVEDTSREYHLDLVAYALPMRAALAAYLGDHQGVKAVFVGTRRTDPHGESLTFFDKTDTHMGWPDFMRVHPVIDWHYAEIWAFVRHLQIPYCPLYDLGYTSLGGTTDTLPNPALKKADKADGQGFRPAYELMADNEERLGRDRS